MLMISRLNHAGLLYTLFGIYALLNILDGISTWLVLKPDHFERERNPLARWIFIRLGIPRGIVITETGILGILSPVIFFLATKHLALVNFVLILAIIIFIWVVGDNFYQTSKLRNRKRGSASHRD